jgi:tetratricopeptide (TPR) repeat protein
MDHMSAQEYGPAVEEFNKALAAEPEMKMAVFGKARALFELKDFEPALALFEEFLVKTESDRGTFKKERWDSEFYRDKCKQELGMEVEQNKEAIPEPRMGE